VNPTVAALHDELTADPKALGYAPLVAAARVNGDWQSVADRVNTTYAGIATVFRPNVSAQELLTCIVWAEVAAFTATQWAALQCMLAPLRVDATQLTVRNFFAGLFAGKAGTLAALTAIAKVVAPTRAEELWGAGVVVSAGDCATALVLPAP
jgi:hypothetical protein